MPAQDTTILKRLLTHTRTIFETLLLSCRESDRHIPNIEENAPLEQPVSNEVPTAHEGKLTPLFDKPN